MKTLYQLDIKLPEKGFTLYRIAIEKLLNPLKTLGKYEQVDCSTTVVSHWR